MRLILFSIVAFAVSALAAPIHEAASVADFKGVKSELDKGVSPDLKDEAGLTPLTLAVINAGHDGIMDIIKLLIAKGADVSLGNPLFWAARTKGTKKIMELLIKNHADVNGGFETGLTPIDSAVSVRQFYEQVGASPVTISECNEKINLLREHGGRTTEEIIPRLVSFNKDLDFSFKFNTAKGFVYIVESRDPRWNPSDWDEFSAHFGTDELVEFREMRFVGFQQLYRVRVVKE